MGRTVEWGAFEMLQLGSRGEGKIASCYWQCHLTLAEELALFGACSPPARREWLHLRYCSAAEGGPWFQTHDFSCIRLLCLVHSDPVSSFPLSSPHSLHRAAPSCPSLQHCALSESQMSCLHLKCAFCHSRRWCDGRRKKFSRLN